MSKNFLSCLKNRSAVTISGPDAPTFLQGLITQDIGLLETQDLVYSCLLSPQGKYHFDFFIRREQSNYILDCEDGEQANALVNRLKMFKLRSHIEIDLTSQTPVYVSNQQISGALKDPRHDSLGWRDYQNKENHDVQTLDDFDIYDLHRLSLGIPDGSRDLIKDKSTIIESRLDKLNAVSFDKGCYMGQELTARMHYRGLAKKHLYPVTLIQMMSSGDEIRTKNGSLAGEIRSVCQDKAIALMKDDKIDDIVSQGFIKPYTLEWMTT